MYETAATRAMRPIPIFFFSNIPTPDDPVYENIYQAEINKILIIYIGKYCLPHEPGPIRILSA